MKRVKIWHEATTSVKRQELADTYRPDNVPAYAKSRLAWTDTYDLEIKYVWEE